MRFFSHRPVRPLADLVEGFWDVAYAPTHPRVRILPSGTNELVINLSEDEIRIYDSGHPARCRRFPGIVVAGTYAGALDIDPMRHASIMGVHFRPGGAFPFFGPAVGELANSHVALEALWGRSAGELREKLCSAPTPQKRFQILEEALTNRLRRLSEHPAVSLALDIFGPAGIGDSVRAVAKRVGLSQRHFIQVFTAQVGLTPKLFCRVLRFQHAREVVDQSAAPNWAHLALACGYYDQSHMIDDFRAFSGLSPTEYLCLRNKRLSPDHVPVI
ncbi:MAG: helix-turn-helix domain-containing protein [Pirellulales bacterium]